MGNEPSPTPSAVDAGLQLYASASASPSLTCCLRPHLPADAVRLDLARPGRARPEAPPRRRRRRRLRRRRRPGAPLLVVAEIFAACVRALLAAILGRRAARSHRRTGDRRPRPLPAPGAIPRAARRLSTGEPQGPCASPSKRRPAARLLPLRRLVRRARRAVGGRPRRRRRPAVGLADVLPRAALPRAARPSSSSRRRRSRSARAAAAAAARHAGAPQPLDDAAAWKVARAPGSAAPHQTPEISPVFYVPCGLVTIDFRSSPLPTARSRSVRSGRCCWPAAAAAATWSY